MGKESAVLNIQDLEESTRIQDPFIICSHFKEIFPSGTSGMQPSVGNLLDKENVCPMMNGRQFPGFPVHPHYGFEIITILEEGIIDHFDSKGVYGRFGSGDVHWLSSGNGIQHSEMFPLLSTAPNYFEMFQIWLNLDSIKKRSSPSSQMFWKEEIPLVICYDYKGRQSKIKILAGNYRGHKALLVPGNSWAASPDHHVNIWCIELAPKASFCIPKELDYVSRSIIFYRGMLLSVDDCLASSGSIVDLDHSKDIILQNGAERSYLLFLQGSPINENICQLGPFVSHSEETLSHVLVNYQIDNFWGGPWGSSEPVNDRHCSRFISVAEKCRKVNG
ncbi:pirin family protein [Halosquirtibacter laminarini]|uniref:Pirin family protein n=1 Tax=Halosquirtibacter laminarini TaxID=3374600 RepID=A0AC61NL57_9BACT|nr:pirin family protein [Prolixibacteraceae bacterium]